MPWHGSSELSLTVQVQAHVSTLLHSQYRPQMSYSSLVPRNLNSTSTMSRKPSLSFGSLYLVPNELKAIRGRGRLDSGFIYRGIRVRGRTAFDEETEPTSLFNDLTASLCSHRCRGTLNQTQRIGTPCLFARSIHLERTSGSAFVLSASEL